MDFVRIANFNTSLKAETTAHVLDQSGIPFILHSDETIFGEGALSDHVFLSVPEDRMQEAKRLIDGLTDETEPR